MAFAFRLAANLGRVGPLSVAEVETAIVAAGLPVRVPAPLARKAAALMQHDKKRTASGLRWVLPRQRGVSGWTVEWDVRATDDAVDATVEEISAV